MIRVLHITKAYKPPVGVIKQVEFEHLAAVESKMSWQTVLVVPQSEFASNLPVFVKISIPQLQLVRRLWFSIAFYYWVLREAKKFDIILLRYNVYDLLQFFLVWQCSNILTVHHTLEIEELNSDGTWRGKIKSFLEKHIGTLTMRKVRGIVAVTPEIAEYEAIRSGQKIQNNLRFIYPNGIRLPSNQVIHDLRQSQVELLFVASHFVQWHGLDILLDSVNLSKQDFILHIVGSVGDENKRRCMLDNRVKLHGMLSSQNIEKLAARSWVGISSLGMHRLGMQQASTLKVREYLSVGLPVYASYVDSGLSGDFEYFCYGDGNIDHILHFAYQMRSISKEIVAARSAPFISKTVIMERLYEDISKEIEWSDNLH